MPIPDSSREEPDRVATMLAEMDSRLQMLQRELASLALPATLRSAEPQAAPLSAEPAAPWAAPERPTRTSRARVPSAPAVRMADLPAELPAGLRKRAARPAARAVAPDPIPRQTILEAEREVRRVVEDARRRIADIGVRTRALLEDSPISRADALQAVAPAPDPTSTPPERQEYAGAVTVQAGPFDDIVQLNVFEGALSSIPGVEDVCIRTFERHHAHFELRVAEPTLLIAEVRARAADPLHVIEAGDRDIRLEFVKHDGDRRASR